MIGHRREVHPLSEACPQLVLGYEEMESELACFPLLGEGSLKVGPVQGEELIAGMQEVMSQGMGDGEGQGSLPCITSSLAETGKAPREGALPSKGASHRGSETNGLPKASSLRSGGSVSG